MKLSGTTPALAVDRHEEKFLLNPGEAALARALLDGALHRDRYSAGGAYYIRSLYFDTPPLTTTTPTRCWASATGGKCACASTTPVRRTPGWN